MALKLAVIAVISALSLGSLAFPAAAIDQSQEKRDKFYWLDRMNRAQAVMLYEEHIITPEQAAAMAKALDIVYEQAKGPDFPRDSIGNYFGSEQKYLIAAGGPEVSRIHTGRSTWDTVEDNNRMLQREKIFSLYKNLIDTRKALLDYANKYPNAIIPAYTGGVQAQPTSFGHFLTAYVEIYGRYASDLEQIYAIDNTSSLGSAALGTSTYKLNRQRIAELLGFDAPIHNSYDAVLLSPMQVNMRLAGTSAAISITTQQLMGDLHRQYLLSRPWLTFPYTGVSGSTIMPQKQNPDGINDARFAASSAIGDASKYMVEAAKQESGSFDVELNDSVYSSLSNTAKALKETEKMFGVLVFNPDRAMNIVLDDYATATELANTLQRVANVPFKDSHDFVTDLVQFGRVNNLRPVDIKYSDFLTIFNKFAKEHQLTTNGPKLTEQQFKTALTPKNMVESAKGFGGPQPTEVASMIAEQQNIINQNSNWLASKKALLKVAEEKLDQAFEKIKQ
jgi:argininosuccinate lyase